jgi:hypothetical protein
MNRERMVPQLTPVAEEPRLEEVPITEERSVSPSTSPFMFTSQQALKPVKLEIPNQGDNLCQSYPVDDSGNFKGNFEQRPEVNSNSPPLLEAKLRVPESSTANDSPHAPLNYNYETEIVPVNPIKEYLAPLTSYFSSTPRSSEPRMYKRKQANGRVKWVGIQSQHIQREPSFKKSVGKDIAESHSTSAPLKSPSQVHSREGGHAQEEPSKPLRDDKIKSLGHKRRESIQARRAKRDEAATMAGPKEAQATRPEAPSLNSQPKQIRSPVDDKTPYPSYDPVPNTKLGPTQYKPLSNQQRESIEARHTRREAVGAMPQAEKDSGVSEKLRTVRDGGKRSSEPRYRKRDGSKTYLQNMYQRWIQEGIWNSDRKSTGYI